MYIVLMLNLLLGGEYEKGGAYPSYNQMEARTGVEPV